MVDKNQKTVLRIIFLKITPLTTYNNVEDALHRANFNLKQFGGGSYYSKEKNSPLREYNDYYINDYNNFDIDFCREVISSILGLDFDLEIYEDDPIFNEFNI